MTTFVMFEIECKMWILCRMEQQEPGGMHAMVVLYLNYLNTRRDGDDDKLFTPDPLPKSQSESLHPLLCGKSILYPGAA